jgi:hypothetical protein
MEAVQKMLASSSQRGQAATKQEKGLGGIKML